MDIDISSLNGRLWSVSLREHDNVIPDVGMLPWGQCIGRHLGQMARYHDAGLPVFNGRRALAEDLSAGGYAGPHWKDALFSCLVAVDTLSCSRLPLGSFWFTDLTLTGNALTLTIFALQRRFDNSLGGKGSVGGLTLVSPFFVFYILWG